MTMEYCAQGAPERICAGRPTGFRRLTPGLLKADRAAEAFAGLPAGLSRPGQLLAAFKAAAPRLGMPVRLVHAVDWLFRFSQPQDWEEGTRPIVWPSAEVQQEAFGLSPTQVKTVNRMLIENGLLTMRDSPNGKRYGRRDRQDRIIEAYGFDLSPIAARHDEFLQRRITIARKGIAQLLETAREYGFQGAEWAKLAQETQDLLRVLKMATGPDDMERGAISLERRQTAARECLETLLGVVETAPKEPENRPHIIPTTESSNLSDTVVAHQESSRTPDRPSPHPETLGVASGSAPMTGHKLAPSELVRLAPRLKPYLRGPDPNWSDIIVAADWLRGDLDISKPLWGEACLLLGREAAAVAVAIVSAKDPASIRSTGGYFYGMVAKAKAHELNLDRTIWKLRTASQAQTNKTPLWSA